MRGSGMKTIMFIIILVLTCACTAPIADTYLMSGYDGSWEDGKHKLYTGMTWLEARKYIHMRYSPSVSSSSAFGSVEAFKGWSYEYSFVYIYFINNELQSWLVY